MSTPLSPTRALAACAAALFTVLGALALTPQEVPRVPPDVLPAELSIEVPRGLPQELPVATWGSEGEVALGRRLFFDPLLSVDRSVACASCHDPRTGFAQNEALSPGVNGQRTLRNAPTLYNRALGEHFMWDGKAETLDEQVLLPIQNEREMGLTLEQALERLAQHAEYPALFREAFGGPPTSERLASALASFVRRLLYADSPVDRFRAGEFTALDSAQRSGLWLYESRGRCWRCHPGPLFTDESFHNTGVGAVHGTAESGRQAVTGIESDRGRFKTPTLRGLEETAPYMHDGSLATLEEVVELYRQGGRQNGHLDPLMEPVEMTDEDAANLVAFLKALSRRPETGERR